MGHDERGLQQHAERGDLRWSPPPARAVDRAVLWIVLALALAHLVVDGAAALGYPLHPIRFSRAFSLNAEQGFGTWVASLQLALTATLAGVIAVRGTPPEERRWWILLTLVLCLASAEEVVGLHEHLSLVLGSEALRADIRNTWVLVGLPVTMVLGLLFLGFVRRQAADLRWRLCIGGGCFVAGAIGFEVLSGMQLSRSGRDLLYVAAVGMEEGLELAGVGVVLTGLYRTVIGRELSKVAAARPIG